MNTNYLTITQDNIRRDPKLRQGYTDWLNGYRWNVFITLTFKNICGKDEAKKHTFNYFRYGLERNFSLILPAFLVWIINTDTSHIHVHALTTSFKTKRTKNILKIPFWRLERAWPFGTAVIKHRPGHSKRIPITPYMEESSRLRTCVYITKNMSGPYPCKWRDRRGGLWKLIEDERKEKLSCQKLKNA